MQTLPGGAWEAPRSAETGSLEIWASPEAVTKRPGGQADPGPGGPPPGQARAAPPWQGHGSGLCLGCLAPGLVPQRQHREGTTPHPTRSWRGRGRGASQWRHREGPCECREKAEAGDQRDPHHPPLSPCEIHGQQAERIA